MMPDHDDIEASPGRAYSLKDHAKANVLTLMLALMGAGAAAILAYDLFTGREWVSAYAIQLIPDATQLVIACLLFFGGVATGMGTLVRRLRRHGRPLCVISTLSVEMYGWVMQSSGWAAVAIAVARYHRPGTALAEWIIIVIALGGVVKIIICWRYLRKLRHEIREQQVTTDNLNIVGGV